MDRQTDGRNCYINIVRCILMQNIASKILCIFVTGGAYAPYAPCLSTPLYCSTVLILVSSFHPTDRLHLHDVLTKRPAQFWMASLDI